MPQWRSVELEKIIGGPLTAEGLTEAALYRLVQNQVREGEQLDFKGPRYSPTRGPKGEWSSEQEFAKDVAAFANHRGGLLVVGVEEVDDIASELKPISDVTPAQEEQRLNAVVANWMAPIAEIIFVSVPAKAGGFYLAVIVPPSGRSPHAVLANPGDKKRPLRFPRRHGADTEWMTESEVSDRYQGRFLGQARAELRVEDVLAGGFGALNRSSSIWFYISLIPEVDAGGRLSQREALEIQKWVDEYKFSSPIGETLGLLSRGIPAPARMTFTQYPRTEADEVGSPRGRYFELHVNGSAFAAIAINDLNVPVNSFRVSDVRLVDYSILMVDLCSSWAAKSVGSWGSASVVSGFYAPYADDDLRRSIELGNSLIPEYAETLSGTRRVTKASKFFSVADLSAVDSVQDRLVIAYNSMLSLVQDFGLPEPFQLLHDGSLVPSEFMQAASDVGEWARQRGVECANTRR